MSLPIGAAHLPADRIGAGSDADVDGDRRDAVRRGGAAVAAADRASDRAAAPAAGADRRLAARVLVADDNADMRDYVARLLARRWRSRRSATARRRSPRRRRNRPDLVLTDVMMPGLDGFGLLRALRADRADAGRSRSILLSARAGEEARVEGLHAGADDYLVKPFAARELSPGSRRRLCRAEDALGRGGSRASGWRASSSTRRSASRSCAAPTTCSSSPTATYLAHGRHTARSSANRCARRCRSSADRGCSSCSTASTHRRAVMSAAPLRLMLDRGGAGARGDVLRLRLPAAARDDGAWSTGIAVVCFDVTELAKARREAEAANRAKDEFLAMLGHELRNPLAPILTALQLMTPARRESAPSGSA